MELLHWQEASVRKQPAVCLPVGSLLGRSRCRGIGAGGADYRFLPLGRLLGLLGWARAFGGLPFSLGFLGVLPDFLDVLIRVIGLGSFPGGIIFLGVLSSTSSLALLSLVLLFSASADLN